MEKVIADEFGKKIGGSRRDQWRARGLCVEDLLYMNDAEIAKYVTKDNVWPKPDYKALKEAGIPVPVIYGRKLIRDSLAVKFPCAGKERLYVSTMSDLRNMTENIRTYEELDGFFAEVVEKGYFTLTQNSYRYSRHYDVSDGMRITAKIGALNTLINCINTKYCKNYAAKKQFLMTQEEIACSGLSTLKSGMYKIDPDNSNATSVWISLPGIGFRLFEITAEELNSVNGWIVFDMTIHRYIGGGFSSDEEAMKYGKMIVCDKLHENEAESKTVKTQRKKKLIPKQLEHITRVGPDHRSGKDMSGDDYLQTFKFYGGEFGTWLNEKDRQFSLNYGYDALMDLAVALDIDPSKIAFNEELSIAFGARGKGAALAHYEPLRRVINLTKMHGAGNLAHEYGHALDDIISKAAGNNNPFSEAIFRDIYMPESYKKLRKAMKYRNIKETVGVEELKKENEKYAKIIKSALKNEMYRSNEAQDAAFAMIDSITSLTKEHLIESVKQYGVDISDPAFRYSYTQKIVQYMVCIKTKYIPRAKKLKKDAENVLYFYIPSIISNIMKEDGYSKTCQVYSRFYENSVKMDKYAAKEDKGYWSSEIEMFARAFACYIKDKLESLGIRDDYLCGQADSAVMENPADLSNIIRAYPEGDERIYINWCFDEFVAELKKDGKI